MTAPVHPLRAWRKRHGLSLRQAALRIGVANKNVVRRYELGRVPDAPQMAKLRAATGLSADDFYAKPELPA